jgi:hypothetical protein
LAAPGMIVQRIDDEIQVNKVQNVDCIWPLLAVPQRLGAPRRGLDDSQTKLGQVSLGQIDVYILKSKI